MKSGAPGASIAPGSGKRRATRPANGAFTCVRASCCAGDRRLRPRLREPGVGDLQRDAGREVVAVGDAARLEQAVGPLLLGLRVGAVRLGDRECGAHAVVREAVVGLVEDREHLALRHARAVVLEHAQQAGLDLGHDLHLGAGLSVPVSTTSSGRSRLSTMAVRTATPRGPAGAVSAFEPRHDQEAARGAGG